MSRVFLPYRNQPREVQADLDAIVTVVNGDIGAENIRNKSITPEKMDGPFGVVYDSDQIGTVKTFAGQVIPDNWLLSAGQSLVRTEYPELFTAISTIYGSADATHFNLPDLRSRFIYGANTIDGQGAKSGEATHSLSEPEMPVHSHDSFGAAYATGPGGASGTNLIPPHNTLASGVPFQMAVALAGGDVPHNNMPPYCLMAFIIKVKGAQIDPGGALVGPAGSQGPVGPQGPPGPSGGATYTHTQTPLASTWVVTHNLGRTPSVTVVDTGESVILPNVHYDSLNQVTLTFGNPTSGKAYLN
jgi:microcystin-dependent protein